MADVFISYSKAQRSDAEALAEELQTRGFGVWWDSELISGDNFTDVIISELDKARAVVVIWSTASVKSAWVRSEANRADPSECRCSGRFRQAVDGRERCLVSNGGANSGIRLFKRSLSDLHRAQSVLGWVQPGSICSGGRLKW